jgi:hypothetical protein
VNNEEARRFKDAIDKKIQENQASQKAKAESRHTYENYHNDRFGFSIKYPSNLIKGNEPTNG